MGFLLPTTGPVYAEQLDDVMHDAIAGVLGFADGSLIRPRWQLEPANQPDFPINWVAFGIARTRRDTFAFQGMDPTGLTDDYVLQRDEELSMLVSCYGAAAANNAHQWHDGLQLDANRWAAFSSINTTLVEALEPINVPLQIKQKWVQRWDVMTVLRRRIERRYPIGTVETAHFGLDNEFYVTPVEVTP